MSSLKHHTIVVTDWSYGNLKKCHEKAKEIFKSGNGEPYEVDASRLVSDIIMGTSNGQASFFVAPDGSKEGWGTSDEMDKRRRELVEWIQKNGSVDYIEVEFGGDNRVSEILNSNKLDEERDEDDPY